MLLEHIWKKGLKNSGQHGTQSLSSGMPVQCYQFSYQANWELVIMWMYDKPVDSGYMQGFEYHICENNFSIGKCLYLHNTLYEVSNKNLQF